MSFEHPTLALPSPFLIPLLIDLIVQLMMVAVFLLAIGSASLRRWIYRRIPRSSVRTALVMLVLGGASLTMVWARRPPLLRSLSPRPLAARVKDCRPLSVDREGQVD